MRGTAEFPFGREDDIKTESEGAKSRFSEMRLHYCGSAIRFIGKDVWNVQFNWLVRREFGTFKGANRPKLG